MLLLADNSGGQNDPQQNNLMSMVTMTIKKLPLMAILTAIALIIFIIEAQIPLPIPIPGVKLGLANAVTLFALFYMTGGRNDSFFSSPEKETKKAQHLSPCFPSLYFFTTANVFTIFLCRIILGAVFTGRPIALIYSIAGGLLGFAAQVILKRFVSDKQIWVCGAIGAIFHNIGQMTAAVIITGTPAIAAYLPILIIAGIFTGILTGLIAQFTLVRLKSIDVKRV